MSAGTASLCYDFLCLTVFVFVSADQKTITAESGQDVTLTCRAPNNNNKLVHWSRADLTSGYVFLYQNGQFIPDHQHPSFKNRVDLQDRQMKDGDVSLILKDVTKADNGTYECRVFIRETRSRQLINSTYLTVVDPPDRKTIRTESGQKNITLPCRAPNGNIKVVLWARPDLKPDHVFLYQNGHFVPQGQHPSFKHRVDLQDRMMKDGDVSLILKNVTINDGETYECRVYMEQTDSWKFISIIHLIVFPDQKVITVKLGQDVSLTCRAPNSNIKVVLWSRPDLKPDHVFLYQDGHFVSQGQHLSFKNRVDLQDRQMKDGDVSLILKDVTINDGETYECRVYMEQTDSWKFISIIHLIVVPDGATGS